MITWPQIFHLVVLGSSVFSGILMLSLSADLTALSEKYFQGFDNFGVFGIVGGVLKVVTVSVMLVVDYLRTVTFNSMVLVELIWISILWVLWLAESALTVNNTSPIFQTCDFVSMLLNQMFNETRAIEVFLFITGLVHTFPSLDSLSHTHPHPAEPSREQFSHTRAPSSPSRSSVASFAACVTMSVVCQYTRYLARYHPR